MSFLFFFFLLQSVAIAENIEEVILSHPEIKAIEKELKAYQEKSIYEKSLPDPVITFSINDAQIFYRPFDRNIEPMQAFVFKLSQKFPLPEKREKKSQIVKKMIDTRYYALIEKKLNLMFGIYSAGYKLWELKEKLRIIKEYKKVAKDLISITSTLYAVGRVSQSEVYDAQFFYSQLKRREVVLQRMINRQLSKIGYFTHKNIDIKPKKPDLAFTLDYFLEKARKNNPTLKKIKEQIKAQNLRVQLSKLNYKPDFTFFGSYAYRKDFRDYISAGVSFNIPLWKKSRQDRDLIQQTLIKEKLNEKYKAALKKIKSQIEESYYEALSSFESYKILTGIMSLQSRSVYESIISEYQVGKKNIFDVLKAINQILTVKIKTVEEVSRFNIKLKKLEQLSGVMR